MTFFRNVVATSQPVASQIGLRIIQQGGNAVDAAIATAAALAVVEPVSNGLGSDAFCIVWDGKNLHGLNASGLAPKAWTPDYFKNGIPKRGINSVTVPGAVAGWVALHNRFGSLPFKDLLEPAAEVAEQGFPVLPVIQQKWLDSVTDLHTQPGFAETFMPYGRVPTVGELFKFPAAAKGLRDIAESYGQSFYTGRIAEAIEKFSKKHNGSITVNDLADYQVDWVDVISQNYRDYTVHELPPNGQGIAALIALGILENFDLLNDNADSQHLQIEATKMAFADVYRYVADPNSMSVTYEQMLDKDYLKSRAKLINLKQAQNYGPGHYPNGGTVYLTTADKSGMMVSFIQSNYMGFGSGCVETEFGISLQNRGFGFSLKPGPNLVEPGKRPFHTIMPGFLTQNQQPIMSFGIIGASMQPQAHVQTLVRMIDYKQTPQSACDSLRWRINNGLTVSVEPAMDPKLLEALQSKGHLIELDNPRGFGAGQFIWKTSDGYSAASDNRVDGTAIGF